MSAEGVLKLGHHSSSNSSCVSEATEKDRVIHELELELAQTKLALVESECKNQDLLHQLNSAVLEIQTSKNTWFQKTFTTIKDQVSSKTKDLKDAGGTARDVTGKELPLTYASKEYVRE